MAEVEWVRMEVEWVNASNGHIPRGATRIEWSLVDDDGQDAIYFHYLARAEHDGGFYPGTLLYHEGVVDIPVGGEVISKSEYQVDILSSALII